MENLTVEQAAVELGVPVSKVLELVATDMLDVRTRDGRVVKAASFRPDIHFIPEWAVAELRD